MRRRRRWLWIFATALAIIVIFFVVRGWNSGKNSKPAPKAPPGASITAAESTTGDINVYVERFGDSYANLYCHCL